MSQKVEGGDLKALVDAWGHTKRDDALDTSVLGLEELKGHSQWLVLNLEPD